MRVFGGWHKYRNLFSIIDRGGEAVWDETIDARPALWLNYE